MTKEAKARLAALLLITAIVIAGTSYYVEQVSKIHEGVPPLIRLHVLANSDSEEDQQVKLEVRDAILSYLRSQCPQALEIGASRRFLKEHLREIEMVAESTLNELGIEYGARVQFGVFNFPTKVYQNYTLPAGRYEALTVVLGSGEGRNWWCVIFPSLCLTKEVCVAEEVGNADGVEKRFSFKLLEWLKKLIRAIIG